MKLTLTTALSILSTLASCLALPDLSRRGTVIRPSIGIVVGEDFPHFALPPTNVVRVSRRNGAHTVRTLLGFVVPACTGTCAISFSDAIAATGTRRLELFAESGYPASGNTWNARPPLNTLGGAFLAPPGAGPATVVGDSALTFPCRATTTRLGYDVGPIGDNDYVIWDITRGGFVITCG